MNVYDFDGTIYNGDSTIDFYIFCLKKQPTLISTLPMNIFRCCLFLLKITSRTHFKEKFFQSFLPKINAKKYAMEFWKNWDHKMKKWYLNQMQPNDLIVSASAEFILKPICDKLKIKLLGTKVDVKTGKFLATNLRGPEKVKLFEQKFPNTRIDNFYTDHKSDFVFRPLANKLWLVKGNKLTKL